MVGTFTNWKEVLGTQNVNMANVAYVVMQNLGYKIGQGLGLNEATSLTIGAWFARYVGLSMFLALSGAFHFILCTFKINNRRNSCRVMAR